MVYISKILILPSLSLSNMPKKEPPGLLSPSVIGSNGYGKLPDSLIIWASSWYRCRATSLEGYAFWTNSANLFLSACTNFSFSSYSRRRLSRKAEILLWVSNRSLSIPYYRSFSPDMRCWRSASNSTSYLAILSMFCLAKRSRSNFSDYLFNNIFPLSSYHLT